MNITEGILVGIIGIAVIAVSRGVYEQRQINAKKSTDEPTSGGKRKTKKFKK